MERFMYRVIYAVVLIAALSGEALAQNKTDQAPSSKNVAERQAPVGHRQPTKKSLPPNVWQNEQEISSGNQKFDRTLIICRGC
jgi:hypothetical protein